MRGHVTSTPAALNGLSTIVAVVSAYDARHEIASGHSAVMGL
jgi:hypothetical protein